MANCPKCQVELTDDNKCAVCNYCIEDCQCGAEETPKETEEAGLSDLGEDAAE